MLNHSCFWTLSDVRLQLLGEGAFSKVFLVEHPTEKTLVALKQPNIADNSEKTKLDRRYQLFRQEIDIHLSLKHPNIIAFLGHNLGEQLLDSFILLEYADAGDLFGLIKKKHRTEASVMITIMLDIARALIYLSQARVVHADIKPENIMLKKSVSSYCAMLGDFGFAMRLPPDKNSLILEKRTGSLSYIAPESIAIGEYSFASDLFGFGALMYTMLIRQLPYSNYTDNEVSYILLAIHNKYRDENFSLRNYFMKYNFAKAKIDALEQSNLHPLFPNYVPSALRRIVENCRDADPLKRLTAETLYENLNSLDTTMRKAGSVDHLSSKVPCPTASVIFRRRLQ